MAKKNLPPKKVKVEVRPASNILKIVLIILIVFSIVALIALQWVHSGILGQIADLKDEASGLEHANQELEQKMGELGSVQSIQHHPDGAAADILQQLPGCILGSGCIFPDQGLEAGLRVTDQMAAAEYILIQELHRVHRLHEGIAPGVGQQDLFQSFHK